MHTHNKNISFYGVFNEVAEQLKQQFVVVKRGLMVNLQYIVNSNYTSIELSNNIAFVISKKIVIMSETDSADNKGSNMETILYLSSNLVHIYAISVFFELILGRNKYNQYIKLISFMTYYLINSFCFLLFSNLIVNLSTNIVPLLIISLQYKKSYGQRTFCVLSSCALGMFVDWLAFSILPLNSVLVVNGVFQSLILLVYRLKNNYTFYIRV